MVNYAVFGKSLQVWGPASEKAVKGWRQTGSCWELSLMFWMAVVWTRSCLGVQGLAMNTKSCLCWYDHWRGRTTSCEHSEMLQRPRELWIKASLKHRQNSGIHWIKFSLQFCVSKSFNGSGFPVKPLMAVHHEILT